MATNDRAIIRAINAIEAFGLSIAEARAAGPEIVWKIRNIGTKGYAMLMALSDEEIEAIRAASKAAAEAAAERLKASRKRRREARR